MNHERGDEEREDGADDGGDEVLPQGVLLLGGRFLMLFLFHAAAAGMGHDLARRDALGIRPRSRGRKTNPGKSRKTPPIIPADGDSRTVRRRLRVRDDVVIRSSSTAAPGCESPRNRVRPASGPGRVEAVRQDFSP